jgi:hypothetical protein
MVSHVPPPLPDGRATYRVGRMDSLRLSVIHRRPLRWLAADRFSEPQTASVARRGCRCQVSDT